MEDFLKWLGDVFEAIAEWFRTYATEIITVILGGFGSTYFSTTVGIELTRAQKWMRFIAGCVLSLVLPPTICDAVEYTTGYQFNIYAMPLMGFIGGYVGVEGVTRIFVTRFLRNKKDDQ